MVKAHEVLSKGLELQNPIRSALANALTGGLRAGTGHARLALFNSGGEAAGRNLPLETGTDYCIGSGGKTMATNGAQDFPDRRGGKLVERFEVPSRCPGPRAYFKGLEQRFSIVAPIRRFDRTKCQSTYSYTGKHARRRDQCIGQEYAG
jgi:hypothetical protein